MKESERSWRPWKGRLVSILGASLCTLEGWNPPGWPVWYRQGNRRLTGVGEPKHTWWGMALEALGGTLLVNASWSGSLTARDPFADTCFPSGCSRERIDALEKGGREPDVILVQMGRNDWGSGVPLHMEGKGPCGPGDEIAFSVAFLRMLDRLRFRYPRAEILCLTLCATRQGEENMPERVFGQSREDFNEVIRAAAARADCTLADVSRLGVPCSTVDGVHPDRAGMGTLAWLFLSSLRE